MSSIKFMCSNCATVIDNNFIDNYMAEAPSPVFSLIYIYAYRCAMAGISVSNSEIAKKFNVIESDVIKAWRYWKSVGLINTGGTSNEPFIEFTGGRGENEISADADKGKTKEKVKIVPDRPVYNPSDINAIINENPEVGELLKLAEGTKGKTLPPKETELIVWMYQSLELPFEVILVLLSFCYKNGKPAVTHYRVLERFQNFTYIECQLETGRTHQIRVHMASIHHPLLGDQVYGPAKCPFPSLQGQTLHAGVLGIVHPRTHEYMEFQAPLPEYFHELLVKLK